MNYVINVAKRVSIKPERYEHFFATSDHSLENKRQAQAAYDALVASFPTPNYIITVTQWEKVGKSCTQEFSVPEPTPDLLDDIASWPIEETGSVTSHTGFRYFRAINHAKKLAGVGWHTPKLARKSPGDEWLPAEEMRSIYEALFPTK